MRRHKDAEQSAYYRRQASACATAALASAIAEVKQAYLNLEQGWLCLAPEVKQSLEAVVDPQAAGDADPESPADLAAVADPGVPQE